MPCFNFSILETTLRNSRVCSASAGPDNLWKRRHALMRIGMICSRSCGGILDDFMQIPIPYLAPSWHAIGLRRAHLVVDHRCECESVLRFLTLRQQAYSALRVFC